MLQHGAIATPWDPRTVASTIKRTGRNGEPQSLSSSHSPRVVSYELSHAEPASAASGFGSVRFTQGSIILGKTLGIRYFAY